MLDVLGFLAFAKLFYESFVFVVRSWVGRIGQHVWPVKPGFDFNQKKFLCFVFQSPSFHCPFV